MAYNIMQTIDTIIFPRWLIPIEPEGVCLEHHAIAIKQGKIIGIHPAHEVETLYQAKEIIHLKDHVLMPGLINAHTHSPMALFRGMADDLQLMDWLQNHIWPAEAKWVGEEFVYDGTRLAILEMLRSGTTCFNENYFYLEQIGQAAKEIGMRAALGACVFDIPNAYAGNIDEGLVHAETLYEYWHQEPLFRVSIAPQGPYSLSNESFKKVQKYTEKYPVKIHLHLHETLDEIQQSLTHYNKRPIARLHDLGLLSERTQCVHMVHVNAKEIALLQKLAVHITHCPKSNLKLASGFAPIKKFIDAGLNVAIGTDGACSNNSLDLFDEMKIAALLAKAVAQDSTALTAIEALNMATINGARALGWDAEIGSLLPGKAADMIAVRMNAINTTPVYSIFSHLVYALNSQQVSDVWVAGKQLLKNSEFETLNVNAVLEKAHFWQRRIRGFPGNS